MKRVNIQEKLVKARESSVDGEMILAEVAKILEEVRNDHTKIKKNLKENTRHAPNDFNLKLLSSEDIFHIDQIKKICIDYRLRFLDSKFFKGDIPQEAISKIRRLEKAHKTELTDFKILAPSKMFKLKDKDDPILFATIGNGYHLLIHKWGNDLHPLRKILMWPFKNFVNIVLFALLVSYLLTLLVPDGLFSRHGSIAQFGILFFFMFKWVAAVILFYGLAQGKNFNDAIWNSRYINY